MESTGKDAHAKFGKHHEWSANSDEESGGGTYTYKAINDSTSVEDSTI